MKRREHHWPSNVGSATRILWLVLLALGVAPRPVGFDEADQQGDHERGRGGDEVRQAEERAAESPVEAASTATSTPP